ncbi:rDNA-binding RNA polymerase I transcriptional factor [Ascoidea rubescens DSM 1968]|uniref:RNA polymerase I-specific transcription initiation factor RRN3 n=1 Tax=Ascoidea rubescens DSM 1968 TaxID=1344418 RepID=A0A1D2VK34_9ASCO|nr:RNA polymerase I-specific transcription initiation factor RRN3 [Ascoidea rubescens DSM 1968]ODV61958.1 RNA polymerase I-specific transcription initiation factor RRN3 [Ascoidea rubescens DSM 1968]
MLQVGLKRHISEVDYDSSISPPLKKSKTINSNSPSELDRLDRLDTMDKPLQIVKVDKIDEKLKFSSVLMENYIKNIMKEVEKKNFQDLMELSSKISKPLTNTDAISNLNLSIILRKISLQISKLDNLNSNTFIYSVLKLSSRFSKYNDYLTNDNNNSNNINNINKIDNIDDSPNGKEFYDLNQLKSTWINFLIVLISGIPKWFSEIVSYLIGDFTNFNLIITRNIHHIILKKIIEIMPIQINNLSSIIIKNFPNKFTKLKSYLNYLNNVLFIINYQNDLTFPIYKTIIQNILILDVELQNYLDEIDIDSLDESLDDLLEDYAQDKLQENNPNTTKKVHFDDPNNNNDNDDQDSDDSNDDNDDDNENQPYSENYGYGNNDSDLEEYDPNPSFSLDNLEIVKEKIDKLDSIMLIIFKSLNGLFKNNTTHTYTDHGLNHYDLENQNIQNENNWLSLISIFKSHIIRTNNTKIIQYILFFISQKNPQLIDSFLISLIDISFSNNEILDNKIKSIQYLSSYLARAKLVNKEQILFIISYLMEWINKYVQEREIEVDDTDANQGMDRFKLFYAVFQSILYIFCFRFPLLRKVNFNNSSKNNNIHHDNSIVDNNKSTSKIIDSNIENSVWEMDLDKFFQNMIMTKFNPLKFCNETVVMMFAKISFQENVCYCFSIIEQNKRDLITGPFKKNTLLKFSNDHLSDLNNDSQSNSQSGTQYNNQIEDNKKNILFYSKQEFLDLVAYFPFDPIPLKESKKMIQDEYIEWEQISKYYSDETESD